MRTPLHETHLSLGARIVDFAGWKLPLRFEGVIKEHMAVRLSCGVFDVSHMGEIEIEGSDAEALCQRLNTNDIATLREGKARYGFFCRHDGGTIDDLITYRLSEERFLLCVNASNTEKVFRWITDNSSGADVEVTDMSSHYCQIAVQGPASASVLSATLENREMKNMPRFSFGKIARDGTEMMVARTGYTGEDGFEVFLPPNAAADFWKELLDVGNASGIVPCGLGARDTLRIEAGYPLYGHELGESATPVEAGLEKYVKTDKGNFMGREALRSQIENGTGRRAVGFRMLERGVPRQGYGVFVDGKKAGEVTSGTMSPVLGEGIGIAFLSAGVAGVGSEIGIEIRGSVRKAVVSGFPLHKD